jgi:hypothetical protein
VPTASNWPAPSGQICVDAIVAYLTKGRPIQATIFHCTDIRQFIYVRTVKGGGEITDRPSFPKKPSKRFAAEVLQRYGFESYEQALEWSQGGGRYLGKMVRWYYAKNSQQSIKYVGSGNLVPRTQGCQEAMTLPETLPEDIDYDWYTNETKSLMEDIGLNQLQHSAPFEVEKPAVLNKYKHGIPFNAVFIGRPSKWGNPFVIGKDGTRDEVINKYRKWILSQPLKIEEIKKELSGKHLVCFCTPKTCHGDVLLSIANE